MEANKMGLKELKGEEKDVDWTRFNCLVEVAVAVREEELKKEERLMKETMSLKEGLKNIDNAVNNYSPDFSKKPFVINPKNPSLMNENPVKNNPFTFSVDIEPKNLTADGFLNLGLSVDESKNCRPLRLFGTEISIGELKTDEVSCINPFPDLSKKQSFKEKRVNLKRCFESGETNAVKKPKLKEEKQYCMGMFGPPDPQPGLPERLKEMIRGMEGTDVKLIIQKPLFKTDWNKHHGRLSIPINQVKLEFLTDEEKNVLKKGSNEKNSMGIEALVIDPSLKTRDMILKRWDMKKPSGKSCSIYALFRGWNSVIKDNDLQVDDVIQLWSFRVNSKLCLALVIVRRVEEGK